MIKVTKVVNEVRAKGFPKLMSNANGTIILATGANPEGDLVGTVIHSDSHTLIGCVFDDYTELLFQDHNEKVILQNI